MLAKCLLVGVASLTLAGVSQAASVFSFDLDRQGHQLVDEHGVAIPGGINDRAGRIENVSGSYDELAETFSWSTTADSNWDAFWLVVNNGGNPKSLSQEGKLGIIYFDRNGGDERLSVYQYTGKMGNSFMNGELIASSEIDDSFILSSGFSSQNGQRTGEFTIDVSGINSALGGDWQGVMFDETVGIWLHVFDHANPGAVYNQDGELVKWKFNREGFFDSNGFATKETEAIPTPTAAAAGLMGLCLLLGRRKKQEG